LYLPCFVIIGSFPVFLNHLSFSSACYLRRLQKVRSFFAYGERKMKLNEYELMSI
jgi:hypothetical protein